MTYPDLQSNPGAEYVLYLNFDGLGSDDEGLSDEEKNTLIYQANHRNIDFLPINENHNHPVLGNLYPETAQSIKDYDPSHPARSTYNKKLDYFYVPGVNSSNGMEKGNWTINDRTNLWRFTSYKLETFNINVTTNKNVWLNTAFNKRVMTVIAWKPNITSIPGNIVGVDEMECKDKGISYYRILALLGYAAAGVTIITNQYQADGKNIIPNINFVFDTTPQGTILTQGITFTPTVNGTSTPISIGIKQGQKPGEFTTDLNNPEIRPTFNTVFQSMKNMATIIAHEFAHVRLNLNQTYINHDGVKLSPTQRIEYYGGHDFWAPIMGNQDKIEPSINIPTTSLNPIEYTQNFNIFQWSKGEYKNANEKQDDIQLLSERYGWVKAPIKLKNLKNKQSFPVPKKMRHIIKSDMAEQTDPVYIFSDYYEKENKIEYPGFKKTIKGMIGYSYDFDILKILLKAGEYQIKLITPNSSPYYGGLEIVNFKEQNIQLASDGDYGGIYPTNISSDNFEPILYNEDTTTNKIKSFTEETYNYRIHTATIRLSWSTIIYLKVFGDKKPDPLDTEKGFSEYGSIGKYFIEISNIIDYIRLQDLGETNILNTYLTPHAIPENYVVCKDGSEYEVTFFTEKTYNPGGYEDPNGPHFLTMPVYWNNSVINKQFLVYGQPIDIDAEEEGGKFYLNVLINGTPKKQEFILGFNADSPIYY